MKKIIVTTMLGVLVYACGGSKTTSEKTPEQELQLADSISQVIESERAELSSKTQETLTEVDSLLETL